MNGPHIGGGGEGVQAVVVSEGHRLENSEVTDSRDGFRVRIGNGVGSGGRGAGGERGGGEKHIQWGERIKRSGMERRKC